MNPISVPTHLAAPALIAALCLAAIALKRKKLFHRRVKGRLWMSVTVFLSLYLLVVGSSAISDIYYQWNLNSYDLNGDGFFSEEESSLDQQRTMLRLVHDTGRNFSFISGFVLALLISLCVYIASWMIGVLRKRSQP